MRKILIGVDSMHYLARLKTTDPALADNTSYEESQVIHKGFHNSKSCCLSM